MLVIGGSGMGKTLLTRQLVVLACAAQREAAPGSQLLLPLRVPAIDLAPLTVEHEGPEALRAYLHTTWGPESAAARLYARALGCDRPAQPPRHKSAMEGGERSV